MTTQGFIVCTRGNNREKGYAGQENATCVAKTQLLPS